METRHRQRPPWIIVILIVAVICTLSYLAALIVNAARGTSFGGYAVIAAPNAEVRMAGDGFVMYDGSTFTYIDSGGDTKWTYLIGAGYSFSADVGGLACWTGKTLTIVDIERGTTMYSAQQSGDVTAARVGSRYAAALIEGGGASYITVLEKGGKQVFTADFPQLTVMDFGFYSSGNFMWAMALDTTGSVPTCEISTYRPSNKSIIGAISDPEQLMYAISFESNSVRATGGTYSKVYDYTGTEQLSRRTLVYGWFLYSSDAVDDALMAFVPTNQGEAQADIRDVRMIKRGVDRTVRMPFPCVDIVAKGDCAYGFSRDGYIMIASTSAQNVAAYDMPFTIDDVYGVTDSNCAVIKSGANIYIVNLSRE